MKNNITLFDPIQVGGHYLPNRIFMAPLTRLRGTADNLASPIMADYYAQRASAGLICCVALLRKGKKSSQRAHHNLQHIRREDGSRCAMMDDRCFGLNDINPTIRPVP